MKSTTRDAWYIAEQEFGNLFRTRSGPLHYVEGWGVCRGPKGGLQVYEHAWVDDNGRIHDELPDNGCLMYFAGLRVNRPDDYRSRGLQVPFARSLTRRTLEDGSPNPHWDAATAGEYEAAKRAAERWVANEER